MPVRPPLAGAVLVKRDDHPWLRQLTLVLLPMALVLAGTTGYVLIEDDYSWLDALYMTVITLSTVGYFEVNDLSPEGRVFTIFLILGGVLTFFYAGGSVIRFIVSGEVRDLLGRRRMERHLEKMHDHLIVCGYGRMGKRVCQEFSQSSKPFVLIEADASLLEDFDLPHGVAIVGDATSDLVLKHAGIERARALVTALPQDAENLYTTMSARLLNPKIFIVARAEDQQSEIKMKRAGADRIVSPYEIGGHRLAQAVLQPTVVEFIELASQREHVELQLEEIRLTPASTLVGKTIRECDLRARMRLIVVAVKKPTGGMHFNPDPDERLEAGDTLLAIGPREQLDRLEQLARG